MILIQFILSEMDSQFRLEGIYNTQSLTFFMSFGVKNWSFDFRPKSFNFIQQYVFNDCLKLLQDSLSTHSVSMRFLNEKDFMVDKVINDLKEISPLKNLSFELSDISDVTHAERNNIPFYWHYDFRLDSSVYKNPLLKGIILSAADCQRMQASNSLGHFIIELSKLKSDGILKNQELILHFDWSQELMSSVLDFLPINTFSLPINHQIETGYRQVNQELFKDHWTLLKKQLLSNGSTKSINWP